MKQANLNTDIKETVEKAVTVLKNAGAREVYLFGSATSGKLRKDSDLDFAVSGLPPKIFYRTAAEIADIVERFDLIDLDQVNPFTQYLKNKGKLKRVG